MADIPNHPDDLLGVFKSFSLTQVKWYHLALVSLCLSHIKVIPLLKDILGICCLVFWYSLHHSVSVSVYTSPCPSGSLDQLLIGIHYLLFPSPYLFLFYIRVPLSLFIISDSLSLYYSQAPSPVLPHFSPCLYIGYQALVTRLIVSIYHKLKLICTRLTCSSKAWEERGFNLLPKLSGLRGERIVRPFMHVEN